MRSAERVKPDVAESTSRRPGETRSRGPVGRQFWNRCEPSQEPAGVSLHTERERAGGPIGAADVADILVRAAVFVAWSPRQTPAPIGDAGQSPSADDIVRQGVGSAHVLLALAERQLVQNVCYPRVIAVDVHGAISNLRINGEIVAVIESRHGPGVVRNELKSLRDSLFHFDLQRVVLAACIHTKVVV